MKTALEFRSRLAFGGQILAPHGTFLPVAASQRLESGLKYAAEMKHSAGFLPHFNPHRQNLTVAQPLLTEVLR